MVDVAPFAANAVTLPPVVTIAAAPRRRARRRARGAARNVRPHSGNRCARPVLREAGFRQAAVEFREEIRRLGPRPAAEETEERGRRLRPRRACLERRRRAGAEDELPPPHSITASERARSVGGIVRPRDFAVLRLMTELSAAPPEERAKNPPASCAPSPWVGTARLRPSVPRSHALQSGETRRPLTFKGKARPPEESGLLVHGRLPKHLPSQPKDHAPTGAASFRSTIRSEP